MDPVNPQPDDLELIQVCHTNTVSRVYISWFVCGNFQVDVRQGKCQSRTLLRRMQALPSKGPSNPPSASLEVIRDPEVIKVLADLLGLPLEDLISVKHLRETLQYILGNWPANLEDPNGFTCLDFSKLVMAAVVTADQSWAAKSRWLIYISGTLPITGVSSQVS